ncbi:unnamed protein product [Sympodiomycopsis kandeliae]
MRFGFVGACVALAAISCSVVDAATLEPRAKKCTQSTQCNVALKHFCNRGYCAKAVADGQSCYKNIGCLSGTCTNGKCGAPPPPPPTTGRPLNSACNTSTQCQSGYCGWSTCRAPVKDGAYCYKDVGCLSKKCNKSKNKCAKVTGATTTATTATTAATSLTATVKPATSSVSYSKLTATSIITEASPTQTTASSTGTVATTVTAELPGETINLNVGKAPTPASPVPSNGDFSNGQLAPFRASEIKGEGSKISIEKVEGDYLAVITVGSGGSVSITKDVTSERSLEKRQNPDRWFIEFATALAEFGKGPEGELYGACHANVTVGGKTTLLQDWVYDYAIDGAYGEGAGAWYHENFKWLTGPTDPTITLGCVRGMTGKFYLDNINIAPYLHWYPPYVLDDPDFESGQFAPEWSKNNDIPSTVSLKNEPGLAQHGEYYLEASVNSEWAAWTYTVSDDPPYYREEANEDPGRQDLTWSIWYNLVSMESTNGDDSARDGCYFSAKASDNEHYLGTTKDGNNYMQVNDPALTLPSGWKKLDLAMPVDRGTLDFWFWCKKGVKATVRLDNLSLAIPRNETAT